ncbi:MAG: hypothetical protein ACRDPA_08315, partial [Solirubrobacteraceae bacterium]
MGKIVALGEVVADVYQEQTPSVVELQFMARPGGDDAGRSRSAVAVEEDGRAGPGEAPAELPLVAQG